MNGNGFTERAHEPEIVFCAPLLARHSDRLTRSADGQECPIARFRHLVSYLSAGFEGFRIAQPGLDWSGESIP
jgi:hypothetical protein